MVLTGEPMAIAVRLGPDDDVLVATRQLLGVAGLDVTMDHIAEASGVSRRTLFRHFGTRERLMAAAVASGMLRYRDLLPEMGGDWRDWLRETCVVVHRLNAGLGAGYRQLTTGSNLPAELAAIEQRRHHHRRQTMTNIADTLWAATGGTAPTPTAVVDTVIAHLSAHFTTAAVSDLQADSTKAAELAETAILHALNSCSRAT